MGGALGGMFVFGSTRGAIASVAACTPTWLMNFANANACLVTFFLTSTPLLFNP